MNSTHEQPGPNPGPAEPPPPEQAAAWGAPPPPPVERRRWSTRGIVVTAALAAVVAAGGGVAIGLVIGSTPPEKEGGLGRIEPDGGRMVVGGPWSDIQHGEFQNGEVTEVSDTSLTARSEDGYERTYTIDDDTQLVGDIDKGDDVMIMAGVDGETATAVSVVDRGEMPRPGDGGSPPVKRN